MVNKVFINWLVTIILLWPVWFDCQCLATGTVSVPAIIPTGISLQQVDTTNVTISRTNSSDAWWETSAPPPVTSPHPLEFPWPPPMPSPFPYNSSPAVSDPVPINCFLQLDCDDVQLLEWGPPTALLEFPPPPPIPAFLFHALGLPHVDSVAPGGDAVTSTTSAPPSGDVCNLCEWARRENDTAVITESSKGATEETAWVSILVLASLASAAVGATLMIILLKCRKFKILPMTDSCPILPESYFGGKSTDACRQHARRNNAGTDSASATGSCCDCGGVVTADPPPAMGTLAVATKVTAAKRRPRTAAATTTGRWTFWRRRSTGSVTERPLQTSSSMCSEENSYSEEPYIVSEHSSALYAELNSVACREAGAAYRTYSMNTYSEVSDPTTCPPPPPPPPPCPLMHLHHHHRRLISDGTYENAAYVVSEHVGDVIGHVTLATPTSLHVETDNSGATDTPSSSAYYSDSSNQRTHGRKRKRKLQRPARHRLPSGNMEVPDLPVPTPFQHPPTDVPSPPDMTRQVSPMVACCNRFPMYSPFVEAGDYGCGAIGAGGLTRYGRERYSSRSCRSGTHDPTQHLHQHHHLHHHLQDGCGCEVGTLPGAKRVLPPAVVTPSTATVRPLPPVPSQYV